MKVLLYYQLKNLKCSWNVGLCFLTLYLICTFLKNLYCTHKSNLNEFMAIILEESQ